MPQGLLSGGLENAIRDAELSGKLSHELLSLRGLAVTLFPLDAVTLRVRGAERQRCGSLQQLKQPSLFPGAGWTGTVCRGLWSLLTSSAIILPSQVV